MPREYLWLPIEPGESVCASGYAARQFGLALWNAGRGAEPHCSGSLTLDEQVSLLFHQVARPPHEIQQAL
jgi:hypothetical protein